MNETDVIRVSKKLSHYLRHAPGRIGIDLTTDGWVEVDVLLTALTGHGLRLTRADLDEVVSRNDKQRFAYDETGRRIRANQGHSVAVELNLPMAIPPAVLYHGTVARFLPAILRAGLRPMSRHDVHLSASVATATAVGARRGTPVVLEVDAQAMADAGHEFRVSANGVWLTRGVPPAFLRRR
ncbi:RNA 2'-phosphotransferase [Saccharomonospora sp. NPDC046836]|uniref:RNA 2'-phosphotransferase n=1 Tax=Saccharomonospora sp. NPDC046836 TaxID=3156921 RepID=UPI0033E27E62